MSDIRPPSVAGSFYPADPDELRGILGDFLEPGEPSRAIGVIAPHAGLVYSGACAGKVFSRVEIPQLCVILAPNHTGMGDGSSVSVWDKGFYATPLGESRIDSDFVAELTKVSDLVSNDRSPHFAEHAIEVIVPFLQTLTPTASIVPLIIPWDSWAQCRQLAQDLVDVIGNWPADWRRRSGTPTVWQAAILRTFST
jgi:AmmeMemoRadiSam system protein B